MDYIVLAIIVTILAGSIGYIVKAKKKGVKCIGCPFGEECSHNPQNGGNGCSLEE